jgi:hypothetical protein
MFPREDILLLIFDHDLIACEVVIRESERHGQESVEGKGRCILDHQSPMYIYQKQQLSNSCWQMIRVIESKLKVNQPTF